MPITRKGGKDGFTQWVDELIDSKKEAIKDALEHIGGECLKEMRVKDQTRYKDQTNNLRSSTGFTIVENGTIVETSGFLPEGNGKEGDGFKGSADGKAYAESLASDVEGIALVLSAGMDYATYVESKGLNVLDSAKALAKREYPEFLKAILEE